ncbi:MAG: anaerobic ribonucleoside-triphosphate reductase activating protein [Lachnospiraceae bacterium]|nr:anaerobic ribonucleoside-triphosphate reductase activating protein [Lachnospiraceae bacterium]
MNYAAIKTHDISNGPGVRVSLFVSGCTHHCKGCFNSETWDFAYGEPFTEEVEKRVLKALEPEYIGGLSLLGGEPFEIENQRTVLSFLEKVRERYPNKNIWCYSGYRLDEDLLGQTPVHTREAEEILRRIDVLVDGEFVEEQKDLRNIRFRGSANQRIIDVPSSLEAGEVRLWEDRYEREKRS